MRSIIAFAVIMLTGCGERIEKISKVKLPDGMFEYSVIHTEIGTGGPCTGIMMPNRFHSYDYFYLPTDNGVIEASEVIMTHERGKVKSPWIQTHLQGNVKCYGTVIVFNLKIPEFEDSDSNPDGYHDYIFNGKHTVE
jgi:hypothetical protein